MQIGVFSDVHGDFASLMRVWSALERMRLTGGPVLNAGDNVGYGNAPEECLRFLREQPQIVCVRGNYDKNVSQFATRDDEFRKKWRTRPEKYAAIQRDSVKISTESHRWLADLPKELRISVAGKTLFLTHYAPGSKESVLPWTSDARLKTLAEVAAADVIVCGHTHVAFTRLVGRVLFVNPGSVGRGRAHRASYAILTLDKGRPPSAEVLTI